MGQDKRGPLTSVKRSYLRSPAVIASIAGTLGALLILNALAFSLGLDLPWLLGTVMLTDMIAVGVGILVAAREVLVAEQRSQISQARLVSILDSAMDAIITVDAEQNIVLFNRAAEQVFQCPRNEAIGGPLDRFIPARHRPQHRAHVEHFGRTGVTSRRMGDVTTLWGLRADGEEFPIEASISQTGGEAGGRHFTVILRDITLRRHAETESERIRGALGEAQARLAAIVDSAMDAVITVDEAQTIVLFNRAAEQVFGVPREEVLGSRLERFLPTRFRGAHRGHIEGFGRTGVTGRRMGDATTLWALRPNGVEFPIEASISHAVEAGKRYFTVILRDITLRKQAEDSLMEKQKELRDLSARVLEAREEEKTRIARELHDELGQLLTALRMDLNWLRGELGNAPALAGKAAAMDEVLDRTVTSVRRIAADLRPLMLDDLGLAEAAQWLVDDFSKRSNVQARMQSTGGDRLQGLDRAVANTLYRALQESLTNIARHAGAKNAWVVLVVEGEQIELEIEDDGRGITDADLSKTRSLGLKGMRERVRYIGGSIEIARAPRGGTRVRLSVPLRREEEEAAA